MSDRPALRNLADRLGLIPEYVNYNGTEVIHMTDATRVAIIAAMGYDAATEGAAARRLAQLAEQDRARIVDPVRVVRLPWSSDPAVAVRVPGAGQRAFHWRLELVDECGAAHACEGSGVAHLDDEVLQLPMPATPSAGYHRLSVRSDVGGAVYAAEQSLIVAPRTCWTPEEAMGPRRAFGFYGNLYTLRSDENWGVGDLRDLGVVVDALASYRPAFVGVNPLHALRNRDVHISPYSPVSRLFRNELYVDVTAVPELQHNVEARRLVRSPAFQEELAALRATPHVAYAKVAALKRQVLELLHRTFCTRHRAHETDRRRAYAAYLQQQGQALIDYATFMALEDHFDGAGVSCCDWRRWPTEYHDPRSAAVEAFRAANADAVDFHAWVQFELDCQLAALARRARDAGAELGLYQDLAVGSASSGSDAWAHQGGFALSASVGAPPDDYQLAGQDWGLPPLNPHALRDSRYAYWIALLRANMRHTGALRIDHAMGLLRLFWIPPGLSAKDGGYVRYPLDDLLGILALESRRQRCVIVGEDLGTVPAGFQELLADWGMLGSQVMYFERDWDGGFKAASQYRPRAFATITTHDHVPLKGYWADRDVEVRHAIGEIRDGHPLAQARAAKDATRVALLRRLKDEGLLPADCDAPTFEQLTTAVHAFLASTPCELFGVSLDDIAGEEYPVNIPGVADDRYPCWLRKMRATLSAILSDPAARASLVAAAAGRTMSV